MRENPGAGIGIYRGLAHEGLKALVGENNQFSIEEDSPPDKPVPPFISVSEEDLNRLARGEPRSEEIRRKALAHFPWFALVTTFELSQFSHYEAARHALTLVDALPLDVLQGLIAELNQATKIFKAAPRGDEPVMVSGRVDIFILSWFISHNRIPKPIKDRIIPLYQIDHQDFMDSFRRGGGGTGIRPRAWIPPFILFLSMASPAFAVSQIGSTTPDVIGGAVLWAFIPVAVLLTLVLALRSMNNFILFLIYIWGLGDPPDKSQDLPPFDPLGSIGLDQLGSGFKSQRTAEPFYRTISLRNYRKRKTSA